MVIDINIDVIISMVQCHGHVHSMSLFRIIFFSLSFFLPPRSELCSASVRTYGDRVVRRNDGHLHGRTLRVDPQQEFLSRLKKRAAEDTVTIPRIYDEELARSIQEHSNEIREHLPSFASVKSTLYRHRQRSQKNSTSEWNNLPPKKRPLSSMDIDNHDDKRHKYSSSLTYPYNFFLAQNYMFMYMYASVLTSLQQQM